jgi:hypothetical protein
MPYKKSSFRAVAIEPTENLSLVATLVFSKPDAVEIAPFAPHHRQRIFFPNLRNVWLCNSTSRYWIPLKNHGA